MALVTPERVHPSPGYEVVRNEGLRQFEAALGSLPMNITATFEGRFDTVIAIRDGKRVKTEKGYGKRHVDLARIVLYRVSDVVAIPLPRK